MVAAAPPVSLAAPVLAGTAQQGRVLTVSNGSWAGSPTIALTRRWERCTRATCAPIAGAVAATYTLTATDVGHQVRAVVIAQNAAGSAEAATGMSAVVTGSASTPATTTPTTVPGGLPTRSVSVRTSRARLDRRGRVVLRLRCTATDGGPCRVTVTLRTAARVQTARGRAILTLGTTRVTLPAGATGTARVTVGAAGRRLVTRLRRVRTTVLVQVRQADGAARTVRGALTVLAP